MAASRTDSTSGYVTWDAPTFAEYLQKKAELGAYYEVIVQNNITGRLAPRINDDDLKEMIPSVGDRLRFREAVDRLKEVEDQQRREEILWNDQEFMYHSCYEQCCQTWCCLCPVDPSTYELSRSRLTIKTVTYPRCGPCRCCCGSTEETDNVDLTHVTSVDSKGYPPPCCQQILCCGVGKDKIEIRTSAEGMKYIFLKRGKGEDVSKQMLNLIEGAQQMERD